MVQRVPWCAGEGPKTDFKRECNYAKKFATCLPQVRFLQHWGHFPHLGQKDNDLHSKMVHCAVSLNTSFAQCLNREYRTVNKARC